MEEEIRENQPLLVDSCVWIELIRGSKIGKTLKKYIDGDYDILISSITITEVYHYTLKYEGETLAKRFLNFMIQRSFTIPVIKDIAIKAAEIKTEKKWGIGDSIIYATCLAREAKILTCDSDFRNEERAIYLKK